MAKIDTSRIAGYADMSLEDKLKALEAFEYNDNASELEKQKAAVSKANSEAAEWKRKHNALLSEDEQKKQQQAEDIAAMQKELNELRRDKTVSQYTAKFIAQGYDEKLAADTAKAMADGNTDIVWMKQTDGAGYATVTPYTVSPYQATPPVDVSSLEERVKRLEDTINGKSNDANADGKRKSKAE